MHGIIAFLSALLVAVGSLFAQDSPAPYDRLPTSVQRLLDREWTAFYLASDDSLWDARVASDSPARPTDDAYMAAYEGLSSPKWHQIGSAVVQQNYQQVRRHIAEMHNERMKRIRREYLRDRNTLYIEKMRVVQVLPNGLLVKFIQGYSEWDQDVFLTGYHLEGVVVDDDVLVVDLYVKSDGRYQYTTVLNAVATVERFVVIESIDWSSIAPFINAGSVDLAPVDSPEDLAQELWLREVRHLSDWRLVRVKVKDAVPATYRYERRNWGGGMVKRVKVITKEAEPAEYEWRWVERRKPILWKSG